MWELAGQRKTHLMRRKSMGDGKAGDSKGIIVMHFQLDLRRPLKEKSAIIFDICEGNVIASTRATSKTRSR